MYNYIYMFRALFQIILVGSMICGPGSITDLYAQNAKRLDEEYEKDTEKEIKNLEAEQKREAEKIIIMSEPLTPEELKNQELVEVESNNIVTSDLSTIYTLVPYSIRRDKWGQLFSLGYSLYNPVNYETDYLATGLSDFDSLYDSAEGPMLEATYTVKYNFFAGSIGIDFGFGFYSNDAADEVLGNASLDLKIARLGLRVALDNMSTEPYIVPYGIVGAYEAIYSETQDNAELSGTTGFAFYYGAGIKAQLNWMDKVSAVEAYTESGIENTFLFAEIRQYTAASETDDPDFSTDPDLGFGITLEF